VRADGLLELPADAVEGVERGEWILEHHADAAAAYAAQALRRQVVDALAFEPNLAAGDAAGRLEQADDGEAGN